MKKFIASMGFVALSVSGVASADEDAGLVVPSTPITINGPLKYGGTGCPQGTVAETVSPDNTAFTLIFDAFVISKGPGIALTEGRKNCQITVPLHVPQGFSYAIASVDYRGYSNVAPGHIGKQKATYYFQGHPAQSSAETKLRGPFEGDYLITDSREFAETVWSPCGENKAININAQIRLENDPRVAPAPTASSMMTTDSIDGYVRTIYRLQWRRCPTP